MRLLYAFVAAPLLAVDISHAQSTGSMSMPMNAAEPAAASLTPPTGGEVMRGDKNRGEFVLKHGDLPNLGMQAMTMAFSVADKGTLDKFKKGDKVRFNAEMVKGKSTVTRIEAAR